MNDPKLIISGQMQPGDVMTGTYTFDTSIPDQEAPMEFGKYPHSAGLGGLSFSVNGMVFETDPSALGEPFAIEIRDSADWGDYYHVMSYVNKPLANGAQVNCLAMDLIDPSGQAHTSDALTASAPDLNFYQDGVIHGDGMGVGGDSFFFEAKIDSLTLSTVSAPAGSYEIVAIVRDVYDPGNGLQGKVAQGMEINGTYTIDLNA